MVLLFAIEDAWISRLLRDAAFSLAGGKALMWVKNITDFGRFCYLNIPCLRINITLILYDFLKRWIHALVGKLDKQMFLLAILQPMFVPLKGTQTWRLYTKLYKFGQNVFPNISHMKYRTDLILGKAFCIFIFFSFPRFWTFCIEWFAFLFFTAWQCKPWISYANSLCAQVKDKFCAFHVISVEFYNSAN